MKRLLNPSHGLLLTLTLTCGTALAQQEVWQQRRSPVSENLYDVTSGEGLYVAVGNHRTILTSRNGADWAVRSRNPQSQGWFSDVAYGNGMFVAVGNGFQPQGQLSSSRTFGPPGSAGFSTNTNSAPIVISQDGIHWKGLRAGQKSLTAIAFGQKRFVAVGLDGILTSRDGRTWFHPTNFFNHTGERITSEPPPDLTEIAHGNGRFVALGTRGNIFTSSNGLDWVNFTGLQSRSNITFNALVFNGSTFIAAATDSDVDKMFVSRYGAGWSRIEGPSFSVNALGRGNTLIVAAGTDDQGRGAVQSPDNGLDWSGQPTEITGVPFGVGFGDNGFVVVGANGLILQSVPLRSIPNSGVTQSSAQALQ